MYEVGNGRVDVADYHETECDIDSSCKEVNYREVQNNNHGSVRDRLN